VNDPPPTNARHANDRKDDGRTTRSDDATTPYSKPGNTNGTQTVHTDDFLPQKGEHVITISKIVKPTDLPASESMFSQEGRKYMEQLAKETVDLKYSDAKKSELRLKVGKKAVNETFDVGAAVAVSTAE